MDRARQIVIVGNGEVGAGAAEAIDAADLVIRFNQSRNFGAAGSRTDVIAVCNTGRPGAEMLFQSAWRESEAVERAEEIWSVRDPVKFAELRPDLAVSHPELDDFCDDYTAGFEGFAAASGKRHRVIPRGVHEGLEAELCAFAPAPYIVPSSGAVVLQALLSDPDHADARIVLAGFGHSGWQWHPFDAERQYVNQLVATGRVLRLDALQAPSLFQGA